MDGKALEEAAAVSEEVRLSDGQSLPLWNPLVELISGEVSADRLTALISRVVGWYSCMGVNGVAR